MRSSDRWLFGLVGFLILIVAVAIYVGTLAIGRVSEVERRDRDTNRASAYRICSRGTVDRAFAHSSVRRELTLRRGPAVAADAIRELQRPEVLPILDCKPNLYGGPAVPLSPAEQLAFVRKFDAGELTGEERGICPNTRIGEALRPGKC